ncbi:MAG: OmpA family protein [Chthoniobacteraceae bacterium]|jgi:outer membrane protein OmpA-like peptidoglycan-associated protein
MNPLDTYQSDAMERPLIRRRLFWALVISLMLHVAILLWFRGTQLPQFTPPTDRLVPMRVFNVRNITIDEAALDGEEKQAATKTPDQKPPTIQPLTVPDDKPVAEVTEGKMSPGAPATMDLVKPLAMDKPLADSSEAQAIARVQDSTAKVVEQDLNSLKDSLLKDQPPNVSHSLIKLPEGDGGQSDEAGMAAASSRLDRLLGHGLHAGDAPVTLPGGALFEFDSSDLRTDSIEQLRKLGMLIKLNPNVTFTIEGYTDSFGSADYNVQLSQNRAGAVRMWLVQNMDVDPSHIQAVGYGATNFLVVPRPVDMHSQASIDQEKLLEQPNRRVEIRFKFPHGQ